MTEGETRQQCYFSSGLPAREDFVATCKKTKKFGDSYYIVEVAVNREQKIAVFANHTETPKTIMAEIPADKCIVNLF